MSSKPKGDHAEHLLKIIAPKASGINMAPEEGGEEDIAIQTTKEWNITMNNDTFGSNKDYARDDELPVEVPATKVFFSSLFYPLQTSIQEGHRVFTRHSSYPHLPNSVGLATTKRTTVSDSLMLSTKPTMHHGSRNIFTAKLKELDRASDVLEENSAGASCTALQFN